MSDAEETVAQRQARIRREKREAKIRGGGQERLNKITQLSGRTPESMRHFDSPAQTPSRPATPAALPSTPPVIETNDPEQLRQQEEFIRAMLKSQMPPQQQQQHQQQHQEGLNQEPEDPMMKMLSQMLGGMSDDPNAPNMGMPSLNPDDIAKATGLPSFVTNMMMGKQATPASPAEKKNAQVWKMLHILFTILAGIYMLFTVDKLTSTFGESPPAPATVQNPFVIFVMVELLLHGVQPFLSTSPSKSGPGLWLQKAKEVGRDGAIMVFLMGAYSWWHGLA